ncbi:MAG: dihydroorotate dehydrogenase-like protein [Propionicimonas sp.]|nr:dihydroorotate dehydrogenase-like protein [Propionicimonas sp.]
MNLQTTYLGLPLRNPLVASAGPLSQTVDGVRGLADGGVGAVVLFSLFEEQVRAQLEQAERDALLEEEHAEAFAEATSYFPSVDAEPAEQVALSYLGLVERAAAAIDVPLIASLNGSSVGSWVRFARQLEEAGAAALELNIYFVPGDIGLTGAAVEQRHVDIVSEVKQNVSIPVAVKLSPHFSSVGNLATRLVEAGADGLVLFNRFLQPDVDVERVEVVPGVELSSRSEARLPRTWIAALRNQLPVSLAATSGVEDADDVVGYLLAGADVVMTTSALVRHGRDYSRVLLDGLDSWLERKGFRSVGQARGLLAVPAAADADGYQRAGYVTALERAKARYGSLA